MNREIIGDVEFAYEGERVTIRYSRTFTRHATMILLVLTCLVIALLFYPVVQLARGNLESLTPGLFLAIIGSVVAKEVITGWLHLGLYARRGIVIDRSKRECVVPQMFRRPVVAPFEGIKTIVLRITQRDVDERYSATGDVGSWSSHFVERRQIEMVLNRTDCRRVLMWGKFGPKKNQAEVAKRIASMVGCRFEERGIEKG